MSYTRSVPTRTSQLHAEFIAAGLGAKIVTVRGSGNIGDGVALSAEIVDNGTLTQGEFDGVSNAHVPTESNDQKLAKTAVAQVIADLWNGAGTQAERLQRVERWLARVIKYLRNDTMEDAS